MPRFSVVIPVYNVQGYLRDCLDSVLEQSVTDVEIIAVDDHSDDASAHILAEYATRDSRLVVVTHEQNRGIGAARNTGITWASGDYLLFLDSDDTYTPGAFAAIDQRLTETDDPDILLVDHVRTYWWGLVQPSSATATLEANQGRVFRPSDSPETLRLFAVVWNRTFRREFFTAGGYTFTDGLYEDMLVVYTTMLAAERITTLPRVCVEYRQRRSGNSMQSPGRKHFTIFEQYQRLFAYLDTRPDLHHVRPLLFERMISHFLFTLARSNRVPLRDRAEYFRRARTRYQNLEPTDYAPPSGVLGAKFRALRTGPYPAFQLLKRVNGTREYGLALARRTKHAVRRRAYHGLYRLARSQPRDPSLVVYSAYWSRGVRCNPAAIHRAAQRLAPHLRGVWVVREQDVAGLPDDVDHVVLGSRDYWQTMARASFLVNNVNFSDAVVKRPDQVLIQTHHGTPLKRMGIDQLAYPAAARGVSFRRMLARADQWDYSLSANQHSSEVWERVYPCGFRDVPTGYPRNDRYYRATAVEVRQLRTQLGIAENQLAVLYVPTVRDYRTGFLPLLNLERLAAELAQDVFVLVRSHYLDGTSAVSAEPRLSERVRDVSTHGDIEDLCLAADLLITDYSSVMFDFANLDRPIVTYAPDWEVYREARGTYFDLLSGDPGQTPGVVATSEDHLIEVLGSGAWETPSASKLRSAFRERFCQYDDGYAGERVVRQLMLGQDPGSDSVPAIVPLAERGVAPSPAEAYRQLEDTSPPARRIDWAPEQLQLRS